MGMGWKLLILLFLALMANTAAVKQFRDYSPQLKRAVNSLNRLLDYMLQPRSVVGDMIFGVILARGQLAVLRKHLLQRPDSKTRLEDLSTVLLLQRKCEKVYKNFMPIRVQDITDNYNTIMENVVREELWEVDYPLTVGKLWIPSKGSLIKRGPNGEPPMLTSKQGLALLLTGRPNESESDQCISLLVSPELCGTSPRCWDIMTSKGEEIHGYPLTHRLLYLQIARQLGCGNQVEFANTKDSIRDLCSDILVELHRIIDLEIPKGFGDLFLEQISLCGMEGFAEFLNPLYIDWIVPLQTPAGCFADEVQEGWLDVLVVPPPSSRVKREDGDLGDGCTMHITGMAAFYLALNIRAIVEVWDSSVPIPPLYRK